jgi:hypothetical protein
MMFDMYAEPEVSLGGTPKEVYKSARTNFRGRRFPGRSGFPSFRTIGAKPAWTANAPPARKGIAGLAEAEFPG